MASAMYNRPRRSRQDLSALGEYLLSTPERLAVALANSTSEFLIVLDESGGVRYANPAFSRAILGGQAADGQNLFALVDEASAERGRETLAATLSSVNGERHQVELFHRCANRPGPIFYTFSKISAESGGALRLDGAESGVAAVGHDKTADLEFLGEIVQLNMQLEEKQTELADANVRLEQLAITDEITGLYNRHYFFSVVQHIFEEARRYKLPLCCFMLDADHFKGLNDNYGHPFGDHVLRGIADRLRRATRRSDILARYGGEEFIMAAPGTDLKTAAFLAERLRSCIEKEVFAQGATAVRVTISVGYAGTEAISAESFDDLLRAADKALYAAKLSGRNRVLAYQAESAARAASGVPSSPEVRTTGPADRLR
jgi:diguanylate cyclase (GGDEF)-like protein